MRLVFATLSLITLVAIVYEPRTLAKQAPANAQRFTRMPGVQLLSLAAKADGPIVVVSAQSPWLKIGSPEGMSQAEWLMKLTDAVLLVRVEGKESRLTSEGDWIDTTVTAQVMTVIRATSRLHPGTGTLVAFAEIGGELTLAGHSVYAVLPWRRPHVVGRSYLVFAKARRASTEIDVGSSYELLPGDVLNSIDSDDGVDAVDGGDRRHSRVESKIARPSGPAPQRKTHRTCLEAPSLSES